MFLFLTIFSFSLLLVEPVTEGTQILYFQKKKKKKNFIALILPDTFLALIYSQGNPIASFPSTKLYLDVGRLLFSSFFFTSPRLSSYFLYFIKMSFHHINESQKKTMALLHKRGLNATDIAKDLKVSLSTVSRHLQKMKNDPNYFNKKTFPKNRKPCLDDRGERHLVRAALLSPFKTFTELGRSGVAGRIISRKTVARVLKRHGITKKVARRKPGLKKSCKIARLQFAKAHQSWTISEWNKVLFSDESNFNTRK